MIEIVNVSKWFGKFKVLDKVNETIKRNQVVVICGPSGSGKSTLLKTLSGTEMSERCLHCSQPADLLWPTCCGHKPFCFDCARDLGIAVTRGNPRARANPEIYESNVEEDPRHLQPLRSQNVRRVRGGNVFRSF